MAMSRSFGGRSFTTPPPPALIASRPAIDRNAVDLPHPDGPTKTMNSPSLISRLSPSIPLTPPGYTLFTWSRTTSAIAALRRCQRGTARYGTARRASRVRRHRGTGARCPFSAGAYPADRARLIRGHILLRERKARYQAVIAGEARTAAGRLPLRGGRQRPDRKSTRLNSRHL